jgi:hypothetical protein
MGPEMAEVDRRIREELQAEDRGFDANSKFLFQALKTTILREVPLVCLGTLRNIGEKEGGGPERGNSSTVTELVAAATCSLLAAKAPTTSI